MPETSPNTVPIVRVRRRPRHRASFEYAILKTASLVLFVLVLAVCGGAFSVWATLEKAPQFGTLRDGPWVAIPVAGTRQADPYSRARFIREGGIPLGNAEGISFTALTDSDGAILRRDCSYTIDGPMPVAFAWTLYATGPEDSPLPDYARRKAALHSRMVLRDPENSFNISVSPHPVPGNWLAVSGSGAMKLVLTFLDTPIAAATPLEELALPRILRAECDV